MLARARPYDDGTNFGVTLDLQDYGYETSLWSFRGTLNESDLLL